uniref:Glyco_hydro_81 domain-containing protein n=1 Tax=Caenorhabditis tropicalis TaxID=1561998 RepID=A0A1I7SZC5_9PELO
MILIDVVEALNFFSNRMMTSSILVLTSLALLTQTVTSQNVTIPNWTIHGPIKSIQGSYLLQSAKIDDHPPTLATIWQLGQKDFSLVAWPPKYCAAVHVYFIDAIFKGVMNFHIHPDMMKSELIKFYPPIGKVEVVSQTGTAQAMFNHRSSIHFKNQGKSKYKITLAKAHLDKAKKFEDPKTNGFEDVTLDLSNRLALVLTNSRFCFAHILKDESNGNYLRLLNTDTYEGTNKLPTVLTEYSQPDGFPSLFTPPVLGVPSTKSVDLLPVLQNPEFYPTAKMRQLPVCNGFTSGSRNPLKKAIGFISADSWTAGMMNINTQDNKKEEEFFINVGRQCSWLRVWISSTAKSMEKYSDSAEGMALSETIDLFFDQQIFVGPDSDEARPLSGNSTQISRISIKRHLNKGVANTPAANEPAIVQMTYGRGDGPSMTFIEYFHMPTFHPSDFKVHLIKAANCEANLVSSSEVVRTASANRANPNAIKFSRCSRVILKNQNNDDVHKE